MSLYAISTWKKLCYELGREKGLEPTLSLRWKASGCSWNTAKSFKDQIVALYSKRNGFKTCTQFVGPNFTLLKWRRATKMIKGLESNIYGEKIKGNRSYWPAEGKTDGWFNNILKVFDQLSQWPAVLYRQWGENQEITLNSNMKDLGEI